MQYSSPCYTGKLFRTSEQFYFFNTLAGTIDAVSEDTVSVLNEFSNPQGGCDIPRGDSKAEDLRPLITNPYSSAEIETVLNSKLRLLVLELTSSCNMSCDYCIDGEAYDQKDNLTSSNMKEDIALRGVDYLINHSQEQIHPLAISFYGGEPLLRFPLLKKIVIYAKKHAAENGKEIVFSITTNGTLLTRDITKFLIEHSIQTVVSLDGPKESHDCHRHFKKGGGTFDIVNAALKMIRDLDPGYFSRFVRCSVVVTPGSNLSELKAYFDNLQVNILANFVDTYGLDEEKFNPLQAVDGFDSMKTQLTERFAREGLDVLDNELASKNFATVLLSPMLKRFLETRSSSKCVSLGQCVLGASRLYLSADHTFYPCEKLAGHSVARIGTIETGIDKEKVVDIMSQFYEMAKDKCSGCWMSSRCSACLALACSGDSFNRKKYNYYCRGTRAWGESALKTVTSARLNLHKPAN